MEKGKRELRSPCRRTVRVIPMDGSRKDFDTNNKTLLHANH